MAQKDNFIRGESLDLLFDWMDDDVFDEEFELLFEREAQEVRELFIRECFISYVHSDQYDKNKNKQKNIFYFYIWDQEIIYFFIS
jgi:hypothetical protein